MPTGSKALASSTLCSWSPSDLYGCTLWACRLGVASIGDAQVPRPARGLGWPGPIGPLAGSGQSAANEMWPARQMRAASTPTRRSEVSKPKSQGRPQLAVGLARTNGEGGKLTGVSAQVLASARNRAQTSLRAWLPHLLLLVMVCGWLVLLGIRPSTVSAHPAEPVLLAAAA